jgi:hypothetical protein
MTADRKTFATIPVHFACGLPLEEQDRVGFRQDTEEQET